MMMMMHCTVKNNPIHL